MRTKSNEPTITDVARLAGVSIATVSRVLNAKPIVNRSTLHRVTAAMDQLGYRYSAPTGTAANSLIIVVVPTLDHPFYTEIVQGIHASCKSHHYDYLIHVCMDVDFQYPKVIESLHSVHASGVLMLSPVSDPMSLQEINAVAPLVQCVEFHENCPLPYVGVDDILATRNAMEHLLSHGRRRIALMNGSLKFKFSRHRYMGYAEALRNAGITIDPDLVLNVNDMVFDNALQLSSQLLQAKERPDAILASTDVFAAAAIKAASTAGVLVPQDLSIVGFDNTYLSTITHPSITTVTIPQFQLGYMASEILADRILNPLGEHQSFLLKTELVVRESA